MKLTKIKNYGFVVFVNKVTALTLIKRYRVALKRNKLMKFRFNVSISHQIENKNFISWSLIYVYLLNKCKLSKNHYCNLSKLNHRKIMIK